MGRYDLGLSEYEFWHGMTLRRLWLLVRRREAAEQRADLRAGVLATVVARVAGSKDAKPQDFFPSLATERRPQGDAMAAKLENLKAHLLRQKLQGRRGD